MVVAPANTAVSASRRISMEISVVGGSASSVTSNAGPSAAERSQASGLRQVEGVLALDVARRTHVVADGVAEQAPLRVDRAAPARARAHSHSETAADAHRLAARRRRGAAWPRISGRSA